MPTEGIPQEHIRSEIRKIVYAWSARNGEPAPTEIRAVGTTQRAAVKAIWGDTADAPPDPIWLVTVRGQFPAPADHDPNSPIREWAALFLAQDPLRFRVETIRPAEAVPDLELNALGQAFDL
jgi:hypothetical protein